MLFLLPVKKCQLSLNKYCKLMRCHLCHEASEKSVKGKHAAKVQVETIAPNAKDRDLPGIINSFFEIHPPKIEIFEEIVNISRTLATEEIIEF